MELKLENSIFSEYIIWVLRHELDLSLDIYIL